MSVNWNSLTGTKGTPGSIANWLNNSTITSGAGGVADVILQEACDWIYRRLRHWRMLTPPLTGTFAVGSNLVPLPSDLLEPDVFYITGNYYQFLIQKPQAEVIGSFSYDGNGNPVNQTPQIYYFDQSNFNFDSPADQAYPWSLVYFQQPAPLSSTNLTNFLTHYCSRLIRLTVMQGASEWTKESGTGQYDRTYWEEAAMAEIEEVQRESDRARRATVAGAVFSQAGAGPGQNLWGGNSW